MAYEYLSGSEGKVLVDGVAVAGITRWSMDFESAISEFATSDTGGEADSVGGTKSGGGSFDFVVDGDNVQYDAIEEGQAVTLQLQCDDSREFGGPARIGNLHCETDVSSGKEITGSATFRKRPGWTKPS